MYQNSLRIPFRLFSESPVLNASFMSNQDIVFVLSQLEQVLSATHFVNSYSAHDWKSVAQVKYDISFQKMLSEAKQKNSEKFARLNRENTVKPVDLNRFQRKSLVSGVTLSPSTLLHGFQNELEHLRSDIFDVVSSNERKQCRNGFSNDDMDKWRLINMELIEKNAAPVQPELTKLMDFSHKHLLRWAATHPENYQYLAICAISLLTEYKYREKLCRENLCHSPSTKATILSPPQVSENLTNSIMWLSLNRPVFVDRWGIGDDIFSRDIYGGAKRFPMRDNKSIERVFDIHVKSHDHCMSIKDKDCRRLHSMKNPSVFDTALDPILRKLEDVDPSYRLDSLIFPLIDPVQPNSQLATVPTEYSLRKVLKSNASNFSSVSHDKIDHMPLSALLEMIPDNLYKKFLSTCCGSVDQCEKDHPEVPSEDHTNFLRLHTRTRLTMFPWSAKLPYSKGRATIAALYRSAQRSIYHRDASVEVSSWYYPRSVPYWMTPFTHTRSLIDFKAYRLKMISGIFGYEKFHDQRLNHPLDEFNMLRTITSSANKVKQTSNDSQVGSIINTSICSVSNSIMDPSIKSLKYSRFPPPLPQIQPSMQIRTATTSAVIPKIQSSTGRVDDNFVNLKIPLPPPL